MAWLAEMSVTPTEPLGYRATELAFVLDEVLSVLLALLYSATDRLSCALTADELFLFEVDIVLICLIAVLHTSEIGVLTFEAHVVRKLAHGKLLELSVES